MIRLSCLRLLALSLIMDLLVCPAASTSVVCAELQNVLALQSYHKGLIWLIVLLSGLLLAALVFVLSIHRLRRKAAKHRLKASEEKWR